MKYRLQFTGKNSNEIYTVSLPKNLLNFIRYDFTVFMERSIDICKFYMRTGEYRQDEVVETRNSIIGCHKYYEQNVRTIFDKIVVDCWIEFICRQNEIGIVTLWNNYISCQNEFEKAIFSRLSEYRHNQAINQWVNILKIQEYASRKVDFIFSDKVKSTSEAASRASYFDLMFNVMANELGFDIGKISENYVSTVGRTPNSPFTMSNISREIVRSVFTNVKNPGENNPDLKRNNALSDQIAMDAFTDMKSTLPVVPDSIINTMIKSMGETQKVYIPSSFKAVIDLEIDAMIEFGGVLQRCVRCGEYYLRDENYQHDYCDRINREGRSCLEIMNVKGSRQISEKSVDTATLSVRCDQIYKEMSERLNVDMTQRDFSDWYKYLTAIRDNVLNGQATMDDFESFVEYSRSMSFSPLGKNKQIHSHQPVETDKDGREVKPFVFEKIDRSRLDEHDSLLYEPPREIRKRNTSQSEPTAKIIRVPFQQEEETMPRYQTLPVKTPSITFVHDFEEFDFDNTSNEQSYSQEAQEEEERSWEMPASSAPDLPKADSVSHSKPASLLETIEIKTENTDNDVKIYEYEPPVKVFNPGGNKRRKRGGDAKTPKLGILGQKNDKMDISIALSKPQSQRQSEAAVKTRHKESDDITSRSENGGSTYRPEGVDRSGRSDAAVRQPKVASGLRRPGTDVMPGRSESDVRTFRSDEQDQVQTLIKPRESVGPVLRRPESRTQYAVSSYKHTSDELDSRSEEYQTPRSALERPKTLRMETSQDPGFTDVLKGIERRDGFDSELPENSDEPPVSHKTKRVMDAIFKPSKPSMSINIKSGE